MCTRVLSQDGLITHTNTLVLSDACILTSMLPRNASLHQEILCGGQLFPWPVTKEQERDDPYQSYYCCGLSLPTIDVLFKHCEEVHAAAIRIIAASPRTASEANLVETPAPMDQLPNAENHALPSASTGSSDAAPIHTAWLDYPLPSSRGADESSFAHATRNGTSTQMLGAPTTVYDQDICPDILSPSLESDAQAVTLPLAIQYTTSTNELARAVSGSSTSRPVHATVSEPEYAASAAARQSSMSSKPFPCPRSTCTKSYKQYKGLKYHLTHGTCSSKSHQDRNPVWQALLSKNGFPDEHCLSDSSPRGREGEAVRTPYACTVGDCTRRYKTLAGLKYHYFHSGLHGVDGLKLLARGQHECLPLLTKRVRQTAQDQAAEALEALKALSIQGSS